MLRHLPCRRRGPRRVDRGAAERRVDGGAPGARRERVSPLHAGRREAALRELSPQAGDLHLAHGARRDPRALRASARAPASDLQRDRSRRVQSRPRLASAGRSSALRHSAGRVRLPDRRIGVRTQGRRARDRGARSGAAPGAPARSRQGSTPVALRSARASPARRRARDVRRRANRPSPVLRQRRRIRAADALRCAVQRRARSACVRIAGGHQHSLRRGRARSGACRGHGVRRARHRGDRGGDAGASRRHRARQREPARARVVAHLTPGAMAAQLVALYETLLPS